jgi:16S rRNA (cytidine1402-2'-O)-methyltransferase
MSESKCGAESEYASGAREGAWRAHPEGEPPAADRMTPGLYLVATPIGNIADITLRALECLSAVDLIACEDTRRTGRLLARYGLKTPMLAYHDHNAAKVRPVILQRLRAGERVALVSDAGTPLISDPGFKLVRDALSENIPVTHLPGASAAVAALVLSGLPIGRFLFAGFLPAKASERRRVLAELRDLDAALVFFESPRRLGPSLREMAAVFGDARPAAVGRELTKLYEEVRRGSLGDLVRQYRTPPKGEVVIVIGPPAPRGMDEAGIVAALRQVSSRMRLKEAVNLVAKLSGRPKREVYRLALSLKG